MCCTLYLPIKWYLAFRLFLSLVKCFRNFRYFFVNGNIFFFSKLINFVACSLGELQKNFIQSSPRYKLCLFSTISNAHIVDIEYLLGIRLSIFLIEDFPGFFAYPSFCLIKDSKSAYYGILSDFIY